jgi:hypothetical protein
VQKFDEIKDSFNAEEIASNAKKFSRHIFESEIRKYVQEKSVNFFSEKKNFKQ